MHGGKRKGAGRPKGARSEKTLQWEALGEQITTLHAERFNDILNKSKDEDFTRLYLQALEYFKPKQSRTDETSNINQEINVSFKRIGD